MVGLGLIMVEITVVNVAAMRRAVVPLQRDVLRLLSVAPAVRERRRE